MRKKKNFKYKIYNDNLYCNDELLIKSNDFKLNIYNLYIERDKLFLELSPLFNIDLHYELYVKIDNDKNIKFNKTCIKNNEIYYNVSLNLSSIKNIDFYFYLDDLKHKISVRFSNFSKLNNIRYSFYKKDSYIITHKNSSIRVNDKNSFLWIKYLLVLLLRRKEFKIFLLYLLYFITKPFFKKEIWLICDREEVGGDNGEALFTYIQHNNKNKNKNIYFCLNKNSNDLNRIRDIGKVVYFNSLKYYLLYLNSNFMISSHADSFVMSPFLWKQVYFSNILKSKFIFLQHGIIKDDFSGWLKKPNKNISIFVTSTNAEYNLILNGNYMYNNDVVKLTGLPRFDKLLLDDVKTENLILFSPTWRKSLVGEIIPGSQRRDYNPNFKESDYYKFYMKFVSDKRLLSCLKKYKFKILFCVHPSFKAQMCDFESNEFVRFETLIDYPLYLKKSKIFVTDYSSVAYDFAYLKKPIIYSQFDKDTFSMSHTYSSESTYNYEKEGFGDVTYDLNSSVDKLIEIIENGCKMKKIYIERVNNCFKYTDNNNCERVYNEIIKISKN